MESADGGKYDLIVAGRMPKGKKSRKGFARAVDVLLSADGWLVIVSSNRFGYSRLTGRGGGDGGSTLPVMKKMVREMGFADIHVYSPVPDTDNPSAFISLRGRSSLEFLLGQFPDFISARSGPARRIFSLLVRTGLLGYFHNNYAVVAGGLRRR